MVPEKFSPDDELWYEAESQLFFKCEQRVMKNWKSKLGVMLSQADHLSDALKLRLKRAAGLDDPLLIVPYLGYGTPGKLFLSGRVLEAEHFVPGEEVDTVLENLANLFKRLESDEVPGARIRARFQEVEQEVLTDQEGYFKVEIEPPHPLGNQLWHEVELELLEPRAKDGRVVRTAGQVLVPPPTARFGVISDIDDTIVWTNVGHKLKMLLMIMLLNERTRIPFKGVAGFYQALQQGVSGNESNPIFYVSSSPWNLYDPLLAFLKIHQIPVGPLLLRDYGTESLFSSADHHAHKLSKIEPLLALYPHLPFVLSGDSGQQDPEIYREVVKKYPSRIRAIYIRSVNPDPVRIAAIETLADEVRQLGSQLILTPDSEVAATHAAAEGLIEPAALSLVRAHREGDENAPSAPEILTKQN